MGKMLILFSLGLVVISIFFTTWVAGAAYVVNSLVQPQYIWPWVFEGFPIFKSTAGFAIVGLVFAVGRKDVSYIYFKNRQNLIICTLFGWMWLSHIFSPYKGSSVSVSPDIVLDTFLSIIVMYFVLLGIFQKKKALEMLAAMFIFSCVFYTIWANYQYFSGQWHMFVNERLVGPFGSPYGDANVLSTLLVMGLPFVILYYFRTKLVINKLIIILFLPFVWHAIILFSSRGALLASALIFPLLALAIRSKIANYLLGLAFLIFLFFQGAVLLDRTTSTIEMASQSAGEPLNPRLVSWSAAIQLIAEFPLLGVGVQMFEAGVDDKLSGITPHVAHNTLLNFAANCGIPAGALFFVLIFMSVKRFMIRIRNEFSLEKIEDYVLLASSISVVGFFFCSIFLDLIIFEPFYIMIMINLICWIRYSHSFDGLKKVTK